MRISEITKDAFNSHSKTFRLSIVVGLRIFVCSNLSFAGDFSIVLAKHSKDFSLRNALSIGIDEAQRGFVPMTQQVNRWKEQQITDDDARLSIFRAFIEEKVDAPKHVARQVWQNWLHPPPCPPLPTPPSHATAGVSKR